MTYVSRPFALPACLWLLAACGPTSVVAEAPGNGITIPEAGFVHRSGTTIVDGRDEPLLPRCVNVDAWLLPVPYLISDAGKALLTSPSAYAGRLQDLVGEEDAEAFWSEWQDTFLTQAELQRMQELGFTCARLVLYHRAITREGPEGRVLHEPTMERLDRALDWALQENVYVVLDLHSAPGGQNGVPTVSDIPSDSTIAGLWEGPDAGANQAATVDIWSQLAERYADHREILAYDIINEPALPQGVPGSDLVDFHAEAIATIREVDPNHLLFIEGDDLSHDFDMYDVPLDDNMGYAFHAYALTGFEGWASPEPRDLQPYLDLRDSHDRPVWLGEFGENTKGWQVEMIELLEAEQVGWALYPWKRKQTWFFNPVLQRIEPTPKWYGISRYLTGATNQAPSRDETEGAMAEVLQAMQLDACIEDGALANEVILD